MPRHNHASAVLNDARYLCVDVAAEEQLKEVAHRYGITPVFVGMFGSRAKGYSGPKSDFDLYVPYIGKLSQYIRALDMDTSQVDGEEILPPQITVEVVGNDNQAYSVQLNFVSLDHYIQELNRCNVDFRIALDNILLTYCERSFIDLLDDLATANADLENLKHKALGRASKTAAMLRPLKPGDIRKGPKLKPSEVTDGIYRLLLAAATVNENVAPCFFYNHTQTLASFLLNYNRGFDRDEMTSALVANILGDISRGVWPETFESWGPAVAEMIDRLIPLIKARDILDWGKMGFIEVDMEGQFKLASRINKAYRDLVLKAHTNRSLL
jgi:predicted nucleotidyltransferase